MSVDYFGAFWPWAYQAHFSAHDVNELGQFIEM
jgi:hypothetical protein